jgi:hypothetical protein
MGHNLFIFMTYYVNTDTFPVLFHTETTETDFGISNFLKLYTAAGKLVVLSGHTL